MGWGGYVITGLRQCRWQGNGRRRGRRPLYTTREPVMPSPQYANQEGFRLGPWSWSATVCNRAELDEQPPRNDERVMK